MYRKMENSFGDILNECSAELDNYGVKNKTSAALILAFFKYDNSVFNEIYDSISYYDILDSIKKIKEFHDDLYIVLNKASRYSKANGDDKIYDEYILYAILTCECDALYILKNIGIEIDNLKEIITGYIKEDDTFLTNLTKKAYDKEFKPYIGRKFYIEKVIQILSKKEKNNCILIGRAGVGKSALVEAVASTLFKRGSSIVIYRLDLGAIVAGTRYRGDLEERLMKVINKLKNKNTVLFIDEIHTIINSGNSEGSVDIASILKPALARSEIKCIGATTVDEYYKYIEKDEALARRFQKIFINEASEKETFQILKGIKNEYEKYYKITYSDNILRYIIEKSSFFPNRYFPDKAIDIMDEVGSYIKKMNKKEVLEDDVLNIIYENMGIINKKKISFNNLNYNNLIKYYKLFYLNLNIRETILKIVVNEKSYEYVIDDLKKIYCITSEAIAEISNPYDEMDSIYNHVLKNPIAILIFEYDKNIIKYVIENIIRGNLYRKLSFNNTIIIFKKSYKNNSFEELGFNNKYQINNNYIDEVINDVPKNINKKRIKKLIYNLNHNKIKLNVSKDITDDDFEYIKNMIKYHLESNYIRIFKDEFGDLKIENS